MLSLWYIILAWKEYNKFFTKAEQPSKPTDLVKKPDLIPQKKDVPTLPKDIKPESPKSILIDPRPPASKLPEPSFFNNKISETPKHPETPKTPQVPKILETSKKPDVPKTPETPKPSEMPKIPLRTTDSPKMPDLRLAPEMPKKPETPKTSELPKTPEQPNVTPKTPEPINPPIGLIPSRRPESVMPDFPPSRVPPRSEFPPYLPGTPQNNPTSRDDEVFAAGQPFSTPRPVSANLRDLSYSKGEFPGEEKPHRKLPWTPEDAERSNFSDSDSLESD